MLIDSDCGLNLVLGFDDSLQKVLKRTMLNQEAIFRNQVLELHRLYEIQKMLMKEDFKLSVAESRHSFVGPFSENLKSRSLATEMKLSEAQMIRSSGSSNNHCLKEHRGTLEHQQISLDLKLAGSQYTNDSKNLLCDCISPKVSALTKHGIYDVKMSSVDVLKLSLGAYTDTWQKVSGKKTCKDKIFCSPSPQSIHLEGSTYGGDLITISACGNATHSKAKNELKTSCSFRSRKNDASDWISESQALRDSGANHPDSKHFCQGVEQCHEDVSCKNMSARRKLFTPYEVGEVDLNKALPDESSVHPIDPGIFNPSWSTSSCVSHNGVGDNGKEHIFTVLDRRQPKNNYSTESSALAREDVTLSTLTILASKDTGDHICERTFCSADYGSICGPLSRSKDQIGGSKNFNPETAESEIRLPDKTGRRISVPELNVKKGKEEKLCPQYSSQELLEGTDSNRSPVSCKSDWMTDDVSSNTKAGKYVIDTSNSNVSPSTYQNSQSSLVANQLVQQNVMRSSEMKSQSADPEKEESAEVDITVRKGAVSLIYFSLESSTRNQDYVPDSRKRKQSCKVEREVPQTSSESYEAIVLKQPECSVDEYCVSSTPFEETILDKNDRGVKLKRGRRMKDFRKEILPGLASLSRQEINEDIKIMELALRSREYKKYRSKTACKSESISPVRSRRSRLRYFGRRYYS